MNRLECLKRCYPRDFDFPIWINKHQRQFKKPDITQVRYSYNKIVKPLIKSHESKVAPAEQRLFNQLKQVSKKQVLRSTWIGSHCMDLFVPNIRSDIKHPNRVMRGLVIEVDGDSHNYEDKMKKDERKGIELSYLGIGVIHIQNWDFTTPPVNALKETYMYMRPLDSRERQRLWNRIMLFTLAIHLNDDEFFQLFPVKA